MLIAILTELFHPHIGGSESRFLEIGKRLVSRGHEVHVFTIQYEKDLLKEDGIEGIQIHRYAYSKSYTTPDGFRSLSDVLKYSLATTLKVFRNDFDVYYFNQWPLLHSIFAKPFASPMVLEWCEVWFQKIVMLEKIMKSATNYHVAVSQFTRQRLIDFLHVNPKNIVVIPNGVDYPKFHKKSYDKMWGRIVYVGRIAPHKHVDMLIDAFHKVKRNIPEVELHVIGSGPTLPMVEKQASGLNGIYIHGYLPEHRMLDILRSSWLFVLPSEREGSGIAALEAMAAGLPVVTVNHENNAAKELAEHGCCVVVDPNSHDIAEAILSVLVDGRLWKEMSRKAMEFAARRDWDSVASQFESFLKRVVGS